MLNLHTSDVMGNSSSSSAPPKNSCEVVIVGGGFGGIHVAMQLDSYCKVILIDPKDAFHHNIAGLRCVVEPSFTKKTLIPYEGALKHGTFFKDRVVSCNISRTTVTVTRERKSAMIILCLHVAHLYHFLVSCSDSNSKALHYS